MPEIRLAEYADKDEVMRLYRSLVGSEGLTWSEEYPTLDDIERDIAAKSLYVAVSEGRITAAAGAGDDDEVSGLSPLKKPCCLYRVGVSREYQRRGIAGSLLEYIKTDAKKRGYEGMFFLVARENKPALKLYEKHGFLRSGEVKMFGYEYYCYEMNFKEN